MGDWAEILCVPRAAWKFQLKRDAPSRAVLELFPVGGIVSSVWKPIPPSYPWVSDGRFSSSGLTILFTVPSARAVCW